MQQKLSKACPGIEITVFGKYRDFSQSIKLNQPNSILAPARVIENLEGFQVALTGTRNGKPDERFLFVALDKNFNSGNLDGLSIGMVNFLGRKGMKNLIAKNFPGAVKLKLVTKVEDLLPLLRFGMVKAVLVPKHFLDFFRVTSNLDFSITPSKKLRFNMGVIGINKDKSSEIILKEIKNLEANLSLMFGVDKWK
jgi:hypothetical protein